MILSRFHVGFVSVPGISTNFVNLNTEEKENDCQLIYSRYYLGECMIDIIKNDHVAQECSVNEVNKNLRNLLSGEPKCVLTSYMMSDLPKSHQTAQC